MTAGRKRKFTPDEIEWIKSARRVGRSWALIADHFGTGYEQCRSAIDPVYRVAQRKYRSSWQAIKRRERSNPNTSRRNPQVPREVENELRRAQASPLSVTQSICGDPLPGRSALDMKRRGLAP